VRGLVVLVGLVVGCARGQDDPGPTPATFASDTADSATSSGTAGSTDADPATGTSGEASTDSSAEGTASDESSDGGTSGGDLGPCAVEPEDDACFSCAKQECCHAVADCRVDPRCSCALDCIEAGGQAEPCRDMCGQSDATLVLIACAYLQCDAECQGI
jgi:hypothetical protein